MSVASELALGNRSIAPPGLLEARAPSLWQPGRPPLLPRSTAGWTVRRLLPGDTRHLIRRACPTIDALYPNGGEKFSLTIEDALNGYADAFVLEWPSGIPAALLCEKHKGKKRIK